MPDSSCRRGPISVQLTQGSDQTCQLCSTIVCQAGDCQLERLSHAECYVSQPALSKPIYLNCRIESAVPACCLSYAGYLVNHTEASCDQPLHLAHEHTDLASARSWWRSAAVFFPGSVLLLMVPKPCPGHQVRGQGSQHRNDAIYASRHIVCHVVSTTGKGHGELKVVKRSSVTVFHSNSEADSCIRFTALFGGCLPVRGLQC